MPTLYGDNILSDTILSVIFLKAWLKEKAGMNWPRVAAIPKNLPELILSRRFLTTSLTTFVVTGVFQQ